MPVTIQGSTIILVGDVGDLGPQWGDTEFFTHVEVLDALAKVGARRKVTVRLNSGGGVATEGTAIAAALQSRAGGCDVLVEGVAASAASVIACAGQRLNMGLGALLMLHEASGMTVGTADDHEVAIRGLEALNASYATIYARKSGQTVEAVRAMMALETWLTTDQAVEQGFADATEGAARPPAAFAYAKAYRHAPARLAALQPRARAPRPVPALVPPTPQPPASVPQPPEVDFEEPADPAEIAELCGVAEQPAMTAALIRERATLRQATARLDVMGDLRAMVAMNGDRPGVTAALRAEALSGRMGIGQVRTALFEAMAAADAEIEIDNRRGTGNGTPDGRTMSRRSMEKLVADKYGAEHVRKRKWGL